MKFKTVLLAMLALSLIASNASAAPERLEIKAGNKRVKEQTAKAQIKNMDLRNIEDPEARKAIREVFNYLNLSAKN